MVKKIKIIRLTKGKLKGQFEYVIKNEPSFCYVGYADTFKEAMANVMDIWELNKDLLSS